MTQKFNRRYGPWAIVTGASSGIGEAFAHALGRRGVRSLLVARRADELERVVQEVESATSAQCRALSADLADASFIDAVLDASQSLDIGLVVSNAGYNPQGGFEDRTGDELCRIIDVNCRAPLLLAHAFRPKLIERGGGGLLFTGSIEGFFGVPYSAAYSASKNYVQALGEGLWGEGVEQGVDVLVVAPGATDTAIIRERNMQDLPGIMQPEEVAEFGLDALGDGPTAIPGDQNQQMVSAFASMPRPQAASAMGQAMKAALQASRDS